jgi:flavodoxin
MNKVTIVYNTLSGTTEVNNVAGVARNINSRKLSALVASYGRYELDLSFPNVIVYTFRTKRSRNQLLKNIIKHCQA